MNEKESNMYFEAPEAVFIDRDGTLCESAAIEFPWQFQPFPGIKEALSAIKATGAKVFVFSNQSCIARKKDNGFDFVKEFTDFGFDDWFICPHDSGDNCTCRKPATGLLEQAKEKYGLSMERCWVIGDRWSDMLPGGKMGCRLILVRTGRGEEALGCDREKWAEYEPSYVADIFMEAAEWLCSHVEAKEKAETACAASASENISAELPACFPKDPMILLSYVNTKLRDEGWDLETLCRETGACESLLCSRLKEIDYEYDPDLRRFF